jgi:hypothetical protein
MFSPQDITQPLSQEIQLLFMAQVQLGLWQHIPASIKGVMVVDSHPDRLKLLKNCAIPIDFRKVPL